MSLVLIETTELEKIISSKVQESMQLVLDKVAPGAGLPDKLFTQKELSAYLKISAPTIIQLKKRGTIPYMLLGSDIRYDLRKVLNALEKNSKRK
jgi:hypothetical protein